jgi:hypothetical protein
MVVAPGKDPKTREQLYPVFLAVTAMCVSLLIGVVRFVKWVWMWG